MKAVLEQADRGGSASISRLPNKWHVPATGVTVPYVAWLANWPALPDASAERVRDMRFFFGEVLSEAGWTTSIADCDTEPERELLNQVAATVAVWLQVGQSPELARWLSAHPVIRTVDSFAYPFLDETIAANAGKFAFHSVNTVLSGSFPSRDQRFAKGRSMIEEARKFLGTISPRNGTVSLLLAAHERGIPFCRMSASIPAYRLGQGCKQKRIWRNFTSNTSHLGTVLSTHKNVAIPLLRDLGFPVPKQIVVVDRISAVRAANEIGFPVVVKPASTDMGTAVSTGNVDAASVEKAFEAASRHGKVVVEQQIAGSDYRFTVVNGHCRGVMRRTPAQVIGDGRSTVADLFRQLGVSRGYDPILRNFSNADVKDLQVVDVLERQGLNPDHIPERGRRVMLRGNANVSTGGSVEDVTAQVHRDNLKLAERAAAAIGIDYAGIDFISPDITRSWLDVGGGICEVNPTPGKLHLEAVDWVLDYLFTKGDAGRIPIIVVVGDAPQSRYMHSRIVNGMGSLGHVVGEVMDGVAHVNGSRISHPAAFHRSPIPLMLADPGVTLAVMHVTPATIVRDGLDIDRCSLALLWVDDDEATKLLGLPLAAFSRADRLLMRPGDDEVMAALTY